MKFGVLTFSEHIFRIIKYSFWIIPILKIFIRIYSLYRQDSLWQFHIGLYCTMVRSPIPSLPLYPLSAPLQAIPRCFIILFHKVIWSLSTIFLHLNLLHSLSLLPQVPATCCTSFTVLSFIITF
jgi:hypothetical protein